MFQHSQLSNSTSPSFNYIGCRVRFFFPFLTPRGRVHGDLIGENVLQLCQRVLADATGSFLRVQNSPSSCLPALGSCSSARPLALTQCERARVRQETGPDGTKSTQYKCLLFNLSSVKSAARMTLLCHQNKRKINFVAQIRDVLLVNIQ